MKYRGLIFDDQKEIRQVLSSLLDLRGYEVFSFPHPGACPLSEQEICPCEIEYICADVILSDLDMPIKNGLEFLEGQIQKGCRCKHFGLMSGAFTEEDVYKGQSLGIKIFKKPFELKEVVNWLDQIENDFDPKRKLSNWFLEGMPQISQR